MTKLIPYLVASLVTLGFGCYDEPDASKPLKVEGSPYLLGTRVFTPDGEMTTSFFHVVPSLDADTRIEPDQGLEVGGSAKLFSLGEIGWMAIGDGEQPKLTRYVVEDGTLAARESLSLSNEGVSALWETMYFVNEHKVYYPDREGQQLVVIDPTRMEVLGTVALPETAREGYLALYSYAALQRGTKLIFSVG
jgi:hypothetical protein